MTRRKKKKNSGRIGGISIVIVIVILLGALGVKSLELRYQNEELKKEEAALNEDLEEEKIRAKEIEELSKFVQTKQYVEQVAKEKLGLVYEDETIFKKQED